jgi:CSLREA domain-containing protein
VSAGYNLVGSSAGCNITGTLTGNVLDVDPRLAPLSGAGPAASHGLLPGSPAIDAGSPTAPGSGGDSCRAADQRGLPRPRAGLAGGPARCDIGAVELRTFVVGSPTDAVDASPGNDLCATSLAECTLRAAIMEANGLPGLDHVVVHFGTYSLAIGPAGGNDAASGDLNVTGDLALIGDGAPTTIIQGTGGWLERIFRIDGVYAQIAGVTIRNGGRNFSTTPDCGSAAGGGICSTGTLTVIDSVIRDNKGLSNGGGGIYSVGTLAVLSTTVMNNPVGGGIYSVGTLTLANSQVLSNTGADAGGIYSRGSLLIRDSLIASNTVPTASGGGINAFTGTVTLINTLVRGNSACCWGGGLVSIGAAVTVSRSTFLSNTASDGAGLYSQTGAVIVESTFTGNRAGAAGGALKITGGTLSLDRSTLSGNVVTGTTFGGGAIMSGGSATLVITNTTLSGNASAHHGGGLYLSSGTANFNNVTLTDNQADSDASGAGDGGGVWVAPSAATLNLRNTLLAGNDDLSPPTSTRHLDCSGPLASQGYNLLGEDTGCTVTPVLGDQVGSAANPIDPRLSPLQDNGGPTLTHALRPNSPALDNANPASCASVDQRNQLRPAACDIGAFEGFLAELFRLFLPLLSRSP